MMLDWLGDRNQDSICLDAAVMLEQAVAKVLKDGVVRTPDLGGDASTTEVARAVAGEVASAVAQKV